jgi:hypothetical protein
MKRHGAHCTRFSLVIWFSAVFGGRMIEAPQTTGIAVFSKHYANFFHSPKECQFQGFIGNSVKEKISSTRIEAVQCG